MRRTTWEPTPQVAELAETILVELKRQGERYDGPFVQGQFDDMVVDGHVNLYELAEAIIGDSSE